MNPAAASSPHSLATASGLLLGTVCAAMLVGALVGWAARLVEHRPARRCGGRHPALGARRLPRLLAAGGAHEHPRDPASTGIFSTPRPVPSRLAPILAGGSVIALALPVFAVAGWPLDGWALAAVLWAAALLFSLLLARLSNDPGNLAAAGMRGIGTTSRALLVGVPLVAVTVSTSRSASPPRSSTRSRSPIELAVGLDDVLRLGDEAREATRRCSCSASRSSCPRSRSRRRTRRRTRARSSPRSGTCTRGSRSTSGRSTCRSTRRSPTSCSARSARASSGSSSCGSRSAAIRTAARRSARRSTRSRRCRSPSRACRRSAIGRWFPYCATLMIFIWTVNILGFIPLPLSDEKVTIFGVEVPTLAIFAATSTLSVTLALALMTWTFTHVEGIRENGSWNYFKSWIPDVPKVDAPADHPVSRSSASSCGSSACPSGSTRTCSPATC